MRPGQNAIESYKAVKQADGLRIREDLPRIIGEGHEALSPADKELLKWVGVFFRKPTPGQFMMRIRIPNGFAQSRQLRVIADLSRRLGNLIVDITTRQQLELRGFILDSIPEIWQRLRGVDLRTLQTGQDNVRNLNGCPLAGLTPHELFDASPAVFALDQLLVGADGNPEFTNLPRKFNVTITGCLENCTHNESQDVALVPAAKQGRPGFNMLVGGKMGSGGFTPAVPLDLFVQLHQAAEVVAELVRIYRDHGPREARSKCRLYFLIEERGIDWLRFELQARTPWRLESCGRDMRRLYHADHLGVAPQRQEGLVSVGLSVPTGRLHPEQMDELARLAEEYGDGQVRLTVGQNAIIPNVRDASLDWLMREPLLRRLSPQPSPFFRRMVACTGTDFCNLAQIETKSRAVELSQALEQRLGTNLEALSIHWSGCPAGCGNHEAAQIGLRGFKTNIDGQLTEAVAVYLGGQTGPDTRPAEMVLDCVPCDQLADVLADLVRKHRLAQAPKNTGASASNDRRDFVRLSDLAKSRPFPDPA
ncbi:MAG TPA: hypothetical protein VK473_04185 [Terriglobales bacterium]|nr:hypothetical protein [Terriglobales bacterium]